jgi:hypothetical protein
MSIDPRTGFTVRNSTSEDQQRMAQAEARHAARVAAEVPPTFGTVGQGPREVADESFSLANLSDHSFYQAHKAEILAAAARNELPGQANYASGPTND